MTVCFSKQFYLILMKACESMCFGTFSSVSGIQRGFKVLVSFLHSICEIKKASVILAKTYN